MSSFKHVLDDNEDAPSQPTSIASDHSEIPSYPRKNSIASPSNPSAPSSPYQAAASLHSLATRELGAKRTVRDLDDDPTLPHNGRRLHSHRPDTASTTASFSSASAETPTRPSIASARSRRFGSPSKPATPSRIGRDFEALLASDETYVLRESTKVVLDTEEAQRATAQQLLPSSSSNNNRVIVERRRQQSSTSSLSTSLDDQVDDDGSEQAIDTTPRPPYADIFQTSQTKPQSSSPGTPAGSVTGHARNNAGQVPTSPDRTTSLQRHTTGSPAAPSPSTKRQAAPMPAMPGFMLPPDAESAHGSVRSRPRMNSSVGLEEEVNAISSSNIGKDQAASMGSFRQRMKKTSGFLRRLRAQPAKSSSTYSAGSNPSATSLGRSGAGDATMSAASLGRRGSKASFASLGASSVHGSTSKTAHLASADVVAVPSIPERFMQPSTSSDSPVAAAPTAAGKSLPEHDDAAVPPETQQLAPMSKPTLRVPSAPAAVTEWGTADKNVLPQRSSSQGHEHVRNKSLGSSDSTGAIRLAVQQLSSHMDNAWKESPVQEVHVAEKPETPIQGWGPSPQLPDLGIHHHKERSGSFLDEPEMASSSSFDTIEAAAPLASRSVSASSNPNTPAAFRSSRGPKSNKPAGLGIHPDTPNPRVQQDSSNADHIIESAKSNTKGSPQSNKRPAPLQSTNLVCKPTLPTSPPGADSPQYVISTRNSQPDSVDLFAENLRRRTTGSGASLVSARSFETAAESAGLDSADPKPTSFSPNSIEQLKTADADRNRLQGLSHDQSTVNTDSPLTAHDVPPIHSPAAKEGGRLGQDVSDGGEDHEQSIRLVRKRSNTEGINLSPETHNGRTATIITAPASPDMDPSALPKVVELSEHSSLRPGNNGSLSRKPSLSSASVRGGNSALLSTPSIRRSPSPISSPTSARTSLDASAARSVNETTAAPPSINTSAKELATKCWDEDPDFLSREKIAEWLGGLGLVNRAARGFYFANFDFSGLRLDLAFRRLCDKLFLRAETQQIDRILAAFSQRYYECNPDSIFGSADVIHSVVFSILLLNTDLHIAELQERMTRQQFVRNTLGAIAESRTDEQAVVARDDSRSSFSVARSDFAPSTDAVPAKVDPAQRRNSISSYLVNRSKPTSSVTNLETSSDAVHQDNSRPGTAANGSKGKEAEIETLLRDIYAAVKSERILLPSPETSSGSIAAGRPSGTFSPMGGGGRRKMGTGSDRMMALKRGSIRGIQGLLGGGGLNASLLDPSVSPNPSRSSVDSWGRTSQSLSAVERAGMLSPPPSITPGFASTLTQTIIKESMEEDAALAQAKGSTTTETPLDDEDDDDQLALAGPPWAKEGSLTRKCFWESTGKRAKDKNWTEVFVVVSKGTLSMFRFGIGGGSSSGSGGSAYKAKGWSSTTVQSAPAGGPAGAVLGGGNWLSNATCLGEIPLAHSLANALPPPGYNKTRPHVFALTLPGGKVYLFQTGHEELINEWVSTCNYWAARQSKEPLPGGVSNMEYGWNKVLPQLDGDEYEELDNFGEYPSSSGGHAAAAARMARSSSSQLQASSTDSRSMQSGNTSRALVASPATSAAASVSTSANVGYLTNERTFINEWRTPQLPTVASTLGEERQLTRLEKQVRSIEAELTLHNELRQPMLQLYSPKGGNYAKALGNWERKSNHLLQELVKYQSYVEVLRKSADSKAERKAKREVEEMVREGDEMLAGLRI